MALFSDNLKYYDDCVSNRMFVGNSAAAGSVLPIFSNTAQVFGLWNPAGSTVDLVIAKLRMAYVSTTGAAGGYCWALLQNAGASIGGSGANITAWTDTTIQKARFQIQSGGGQGKFTGSAATVTAPIIGRQIGLSQTVLTAATTSSPTFVTSEDYDGDFIVAPNCAVFLAGNIATLSTWAATVLWVERPLQQL